MSEVLKFPTEKLKSKFRSKLDLYRMLTQQLHYLVPNYRRCPVSYMKDLLAGRKRALKQYKLSTMSVPDYPELSVKNMYPTLKNDEVVPRYLPDYRNIMLPDKEFFHKLICTLYPAEMYEIIVKAHKNRRIDNPEKDDELIEISAEIAKEIEEVILLPTKPRKTIHLLKKKSKKAKQRKPPRKYNVDLQTIINGESAIENIIIRREEENAIHDTNATDAHDMNIDSANKEESIESQREF